MKRLPGLTARKAVQWRISMCISVSSGISREGLMTSLRLCHHPESCLAWTSSIRTRLLISASLSLASSLQGVPRLPSLINAPWRGCGIWKSTWKEAKRNKNQYFCLSQHLCVLGVGKVDVHVINVLPSTHSSFSACLLKILVCSPW